jgi:hypothetical protein
LHASQAQILGELASRHHFDLDMMQRNAWIGQIANLKEQLCELLTGHIFFEFSIPRMGMRVDVLLLVRGIIFVIEYKIGAKNHDGHAVDQVTDYALDLKNFHEGSHDRYVVPILVSTKADRQKIQVQWFRDRVAIPLLSNGSDLGEIVAQTPSLIPRQEAIDAVMWSQAGYKPTPTIVEAAKALYRGHSVEEISRSDAGATNLTHLTTCVSEIIEFSKRPFVS